MRSNGKHGIGVSSAGALLRACRLLIAFMLVAVPFALLPAQQIEEPLDAILEIASRR